MIDDMISFLNTGSTADYVGKGFSGGSAFMFLSNLFTDIDVFNKYIISVTGVVALIYMCLKVYNIVLDNRIKKKTLNDDSTDK